ncbi:unnamed protein product [Pseudo-nitzschia multistriata]|uniref:Uncharacterized protein n=1 Tax=Pseudo-nitzschia multistriata TaxID=183589 RepID=A0A448Z4B7_9STRA|nr:unnamed protein product [Pseudo-nitzschia multistriata]
MSCLYSFQIISYLASLLLLISSSGVIEEVSSHSVNDRRCTRRVWIQISSASIAVAQHPGISYAETRAATNPVEKLMEAQETLNTLLENYERATTDCTFADVPRELLETKNKELLLEKAATNALFDKSASIETCKTTNRIVRDYLGVTGKG